MKANAPRVLFIVSQPFLQWRGSPIRVNFDVMALSQLGYEVGLLTLPIGETPDLPPGVRLIRTPNLFRARNVPIGPSVLKALFDLVLFFHALALILRRKPAILHGVEDAGVVAVVLGRLTRRPAVFEKHSDPGSHARGRMKNAVLKIYARAEAFALRRAAAIIGTGPGLAAQALAVAPGATVHSIPDIPSSLRAADAREAARLRDVLKQDPDECLLMYGGSLAVYQGVDLLMDSIPRVVSRHPKARFVIICNPSPAAEQKKAQLAERGVAGRVTFLGPVHPDQISNYLAAADILVSPRLAGANTPLKVLDYLKAGRAVLATDTEANRLLLNESIALLVPPTPEALTDGFDRLIADPSLRERLAAAGRAEQQRAYTFDVFRDGLNRCYQPLNPPGDPSC